MIYEKLSNLAEQLESMIYDGVQLVHGGNLFNWDDTVIVDILEEINKQKEESALKQVNSGDTLIDIVTKEEMTVTDTDENNVYMEPVRTPIKFSKTRIWEHYELKNET